MNDILQIKETIEVLKRMRSDPVYDQIEGRLYNAQRLLDDILSDACADGKNRLGALLVIEAVGPRRKIARVKKTKRLLSLSLTESKDFVEQYFEDNGAGPLKKLTVVPDEEKHE